MWAWGYNGYGQLGDDTTTNRASPVQVGGLGGVTAVAGGTYHSLALKSDGTVWAWGHNGCGQLGDGTTTDRWTAVQAGGLAGMTGVAGGGSHSLARKNNRVAWAWGHNGCGQLGDGTTTNRSTPVQVSGLGGVTAVAGGNGHSLARKSDGTVRATVGGAGFRVSKLQRWADTCRSPSQPAAPATSAPLRSASGTDARYTRPACSGRAGTKRRPFQKPDASDEMLKRGRRLTTSLKHACAGVQHSAGVRVALTVVTWFSLTRTFVLVMVI